MSSKFCCKGGSSPSRSNHWDHFAGGCNTPTDRANTRGGDSKAGAAYAEPIRFKVTSLKYDIILGLPWLEKGNKRYFGRQERSPLPKVPRELPYEQSKASAGTAGEGRVKLM
jgi:hypothetical protein